MDTYQQCQRDLTELAAALSSLGLWESSPPSLEALSSTEPFAIDTLSCSQWLQWIFIPRMGMLVENRLPLPSAMAISPYIEEALQGIDGHQAIVAVTRNIDRLFGE